jgi:hypothetical protein
MNPITEAMATRAIGQYPISISTSLALESAFGHYPEKPIVNPPPITAVNNIWFNVRTLIRNYIGAMDQALADHMTPDQLATGLMEELTVIESVMAAQSQGYCNSVFYVADYSRMTHTFSNAFLRSPKTPKQRLYATLEDATIKRLVVAPISQPIRRFNYELVAANNLFPKSFIVTHLPIDLLSRYSFQALSLLESHTGTIKGPALWNTKLTGGKDHPEIPFSRFTLQVFGDNGHMFSPMPQRLKDIVLRLAKLDNWSAVTTKDRIRFSLGNIPNDVDRASLLKLL